MGHHHLRAPDTCEYGNIAFGKNADDAFRIVTAGARHEYGAGGYTGTIAEATSFTHPYELPPRVTVSKMLGWIDDAVQLRHAEEESDYRRSLDLFDRRVQDKQLKKAQAKVNKTPEAHRVRVARMAEIVDDKWGPALCLKANKGETKTEKERFGLKGTRQQVFYFRGLASS